MSDQPLDDTDADWETKREIRHQPRPKESSHKRQLRRMGRASVKALEDGIGAGMLALVLMAALDLVAHDTNERIGLGYWACVGIVVVVVVLRRAWSNFCDD